MEYENLNITNKDVVINNENTNCVYEVIKDNKKIDEGICKNITLTSNGSYEVIFKDSLTNSITTYKYVIDKEPPKIKLEQKKYKITNKEKFTIKDKITVTDNIDSNISNIETNIDTINFNETGIKKIDIKAYDSAGNIGTEKIYVTVVNDNKSLIKLGQFSLIIVILFLIILLYKYIRSIKLEKRFSKYSIKSFSSEQSLFDSLYNKYNSFIDTYSSYLSSSNVFTKMGKKYIKYSFIFDKKDPNGYKFVFKKIITGFIYLFIVIIFNLIRSTLIKPYQMIIPFVLGFYTLDIIYIYKYAIYRKKIENDMMNAITVMNNAFKSGRSIMQAVLLVSDELKGPIAKEFKKIGLELSYGIEVEDAFKRFSNRVNLSEAVYLTSSLSVLNKTGGNIIKVFDSIEKTLFSKKKLESEYKSLTSSSKMITIVLIFIPIVFTIFIGVINRNYFMPLIEKPLGIVLIVLMIIIYITYIIVVQKVMKVRGIK